VLILCITRLPCKLSKITKDKLIFKYCHEEKTFNTNSRKHNKTIQKLKLPTIHGKGKMATTFQAKSLYL
jgi:hypothetical protein